MNRTRVGHESDQQPPSRRAFLGQAAGSGFAAWLGLELLAPGRVEGQDPPPTPQPTPPPTGAGEIPPPPEEFPRQATSDVADMVGSAHSQIDRVRELVTARPRLANATYDWGFGDWESALGAASHMGRRDIAEILLAHGARPDIFAFTLLGKVDVVRAMIAASPGLERTPGPHGITLFAHAQNSLKRNDDEAAKVTLEYLSSLEHADERAESQILSPRLKRRYYGDFRFGPGEDQVITIEKHRTGSLAFTIDTHSTRVLHKVGDHTFAPAGAPEVRIVFQLKVNRAQEITVHDPTPIVRGVRID